MDQWWQHFHHHIERWVEVDGAWTAEEIRDELRSARAQLWCFWDDKIIGIWVTKINSAKEHTWGVVWGCAGDFSEYKDDSIAFFGIIEDWFREQGCEFVEWIGRKGWQRVFPDYREHAIVLRKEL